MKVFDKIFKKTGEARSKVSLLALVTLAIVLYANACTQDFVDTRNTREVASIEDPNGPGNGDNDDNNGGDEAEKEEVYDPSLLSYSVDIAPLIMKNCTPCHGEGDTIAPFPLVTYEDFVNHADFVMQSIKDRTMPPSGVNASGSCNNFTNETFYLTDNQIQMISDWVDEGMYEGDPDKMPAIPESTITIANPDAIIRLPQPYTPSPILGGIDDYRCFVVDPGNDEDVYLTGVEVRPGDPRVVHHVITFMPSNIIAQGIAELKQGASLGAPGYPCFGGAGTASHVVTLWAPGTQGSAETKDPVTGEEMGLLIPAGRKLIIQMHYNTEQGVFPDQTEIALKYTKDNKNSKKVEWLMISNFALFVLPGFEKLSTIMIPQDLILTKWLDTVYHSLSDLNIIPLIIAEAIIATWTNPPPIPGDMTIYGVAPHSHLMGRELTVEKTNFLFGIGEQTKCLLDVPKFDFDWQMAYKYTEPVELKATDRLTVNCTFDSRGRILPAIFGENTNDEMCLAFLLVHEKPLFGIPGLNFATPKFTNSELISNANNVTQQTYPGIPNLPSKELVDYILRQNGAQSQ